MDMLSGCSGLLCQLSIDYIIFKMRWKMADISLSIYGSVLLYMSITCFGCFLSQLFFYEYSLP